MKIFLGTLIGLIVVFVTIGLLEQLGHYFFPLPFEFEPGNLEGLKDKLDLIPTGAYITVVLAHGIGLFAGCLAANRIDSASRYSIYIIVGFIFLGTVSNLFMVPHPVWFSIADISIVALIGAFFIGKKKAQIRQKE